MVHNIAKRNNVGTLLRSATAFDVAEVGAPRAAAARGARASARTAAVVLAVRAGLHCGGAQDIHLWGPGLGRLCAPAPL